METNPCNRVVIVGAGHGGTNAAALLRQHGYTGDVVLAGEELDLPYQRPPLSKDYLKAELAPNDLLIKPEQFYAEQAIDLKLGWTARNIDPARRRVEFEPGESLEYDALILATGAEPRRLSVPGADLSNVCELRTRIDGTRLHASLGPGRRIVIVGGGYVGLEVAASATHLGAEVVVLEREDRVLARVASPELAAWLTDHHRKAGTHIETRADVASFVDRGDGSVGAVSLADGREFECDVALVGVGALPCDGIAIRAGLACDGGVVVDTRAATSEPAIYAIGDITRRPLHHYAGAYRLESIPNAIEQAKQAVCDILGIQPPKPEVPWFWSDQFDAKVKIAGLMTDVDRTVLRGSLDSGHFAFYHCSGEKIVAVETVNSGTDFMAGKQFIDRRIAVDPARLGDTAVSLRELAA